MTDWNSDLQPDPNKPAAQASGPGLLTIAVNIFTAPSEAFAALQSRPSFLFPLLLSIIPTMVLYGWYFQIVDYAWFIDDTIAQMPTMQEAQREAVTAAMQSQSRTLMMVSSTLGGSIGILVIYALQAGYLAIVSALLGDSYRFRHWFSLICWTSLPYLLVVIVMAINIFMSPNGQINMNNANSLSLGNLGIPSADNSLMRTVLTALNLPMFWSIALTLLGYRQWLQASNLRAATVVLGPYVAIIGILAYFAFT
jgi:hypothetical protein